MALISAKAYAEKHGFTRQVIIGKHLINREFPTPKGTKVNEQLWDSRELDAYFKRHPVQKKNCKKRVLKETLTQEEFDVYVELGGSEWLHKRLRR